MNISIFDAGVTYSVHMWKTMKLILSGLNPEERGKHAKIN